MGSAGSAISVEGMDDEWFYPIKKPIPETKNLRLGIVQSIDIVGRLNVSYVSKSVKLHALFRKEPESSFGITSAVFLFIQTQI